MEKIKEEDIYDYYRIKHEYDTCRLPTDAEFIDLKLAIRLLNQKPKLQHEPMLDCDNGFILDKKGNKVLKEDIIGFDQYPNYIKCSTKDGKKVKLYAGVQEMHLLCSVLNLQSELTKVKEERDSLKMQIEDSQVNCDLCQTHGESNK